MLLFIYFIIFYTFYFIYIQFLCSSFMLIHRDLIMMIDINHSPVLCLHASKTNLTSQYSGQSLA